MNSIIEKAVEQHQSFLGCESSLLELEAAYVAVSEEFTLATALQDDEQGREWLKASGLSKEVEDQTVRLDAIGAKLEKARESYEAAKMLIDLWPEVLTLAVEKFIEEGGVTSEVVSAIGFDLTQLTPYRKEIRDGLNARRFGKARARFEEMCKRFPEAPAAFVDDVASQIEEAEARAAAAAVAASADN